MCYSVLVVIQSCLPPTDTILDEVEPILMVYYIILVACSCHRINYIDTLWLQYIRQPNPSIGIYTIQCLKFSIIVFAFCCRQRACPCNLHQSSFSCWIHGCAAAACGISWTLYDAYWTTTHMDHYWNQKWCHIQIRFEMPFLLLR